ncbi:ornithine cyclodeaminase family protein [Kordiimonas pumila]|uniref:Ornithine cyclodeaminase family protein n=1 Tax=Kordiimonas pumila TaxID=2161677 RepID=A0ABV7D3B4_9PROT|nr:ornithine cyclodeaminase family protein [Kordiimonas pumila]
MSNFAVYYLDDVEKWLDYPGCIGAMRLAMAEFTGGGREQPLREVQQVRTELEMFAQMPGIAGEKIGFGAKVISVYYLTDNLRRSAHRGVVVLFDTNSGEVLAVADAHEVTKVRTACASAMATDMLARKDSEVLSIFGTGTQAESHIKALLEVRPFRKVIIWGRPPGAGATFAERMSAEGVRVDYVASAEEAAGQSDVICTVTGSRTPVVVRDWVKPGTHINAVGSSVKGPVEVDNALMRDSVYVADSCRSVRAAGAEFIAAIEAGVIDDSHMVGEIGDVLLGRIPGRENDEQITFYKSLGHVFQDLASVAYIYKRATA